MAGMKSSATVQQMQPLASSTMFSTGQLASAHDLRISPSTPSLPNSLTSTASFLPLALLIRCRINVVLPDPRKPVTTVTGTLASVFIRQPPKRLIWGESVQAIACEKFPDGCATARYRSVLLRRPLRLRPHPAHLHPTSVRK